MAAISGGLVAVFVLGLVLGWLGGMLAWALNEK
jgi:hypothetical protein